MANLKQFIDQFSERKITDIQKSLSVKNKVVTGKLSNSLRYNIIQNGELYFTVQFFGEEGLLYVSQGRKPGKYPPINNIKNWMAAKKIDTKALYPIMRKIFNQGIEPALIFEDVFGQEAFKEFAGELKSVAIDEIKQQLKLLFVQNNIKTK